MLRSYLRPLAHSVRSVWGTNGLDARLTEMDRKLNRLGEHIQPAQPAAPALEPPPPQSVPRLDVNLLLHQARSAMLREMPPGAHRLLSAGCAGRWYFDWIEHCYGHVSEHLGIEYYSPRPDDLPDNVTWIANTASDMSGVESGTCDLVFSGQNLEHLWPHEVSGFLMEAARVLKPGGHIVVDSPNRRVTAPLNWSHPEHTIELTAPEIDRLLELAGFDVTKRVGLWLCRDPKSGRVLSFDPNVADPDWSVAERLIVASQHPEDAFIWWLEGRRNGAAADRAGIDSLLGDVFREAWTERTTRLVVPPGRQIETRPDGEWVRMAPGETGVAFYGPYMPLRAGRHRVVFDIMPDAGREGVCAVCELCIGPDGTVLRRGDVTADMRQVVLETELAAQEFGGQFRCVSITGGFSVRRYVRLEEMLA
jgi:SAM-dependent methyltransferase